MNYVDVIEGLLKNGANPNIRDDYVSCLYEITGLICLQYYMQFTVLFIVLQCDHGCENQSFVK